MNVIKTEGMIVDFWRTRDQSNTFSSVGEEVVVEEYKYLSVHLGNRLDWRHNTDGLSKKGQSRLYLLRNHISFSVFS